MFKLTPFDDQVLTLFGMTYSSWHIDAAKTRMVCPQLKLRFGPSLYGFGMQARSTGTSLDREYDVGAAPRRLSVHGQILLRREFRRVISEVLDVPAKGEKPNDTADAFKYGSLLSKHNALLNHMMRQQVQSMVLGQAAAPAVTPSRSLTAVELDLLTKQGLDPGMYTP